MSNLSLGAKNDTVVDILRKHLSPALIGRGWDALLKALAVGDQYKAGLAEAAFEQLFKSSASGVYLDRLMADDGVTRPPGIGIGDEAFRALGIKTTAKKLLAEVILEVLETYYGSEATRAHITSSTSEPFALANGDDLYVEINGQKIIRIVFNEDSFTNIGAATALEVATVITRSFRELGGTAYAQAFQDPETGGSFVRVFSGALGLMGSLRILGGRAQNQLLFPARIHTSPDGPQVGTTWDLVPGNGVNGIDSGRVRFTWSAGTDPDLQDVFVDDYVNIYGSVFNVANRGAFKILAATTTYFEVENLSAIAQATVAQASVLDLIFFRPERKTIQSTGRMATAIQGSPGTLEVILPATTQVIQREENTAAYLHGHLHSTSISSGSRDSAGLVTVNTSTAHGLQAGQWFFSSNIKPAIGSTNESVESGDPTSVHSGTYYNACVILNDGRIFVCGGNNDTEGTDLNSVYAYTPSTGLWTVLTDMTVGRSAHSATVMPDGRVLVVGGPSSGSSVEIYDPNTNTWSPTTSTNGTYSYHSAVLLKDGRVMVIGEVTCEIYNPSTSTWTYTASHNTSREENRSVVLDDGRVLVVGGPEYYGQVYNPLNDTWASTSNHSTNTLYGMTLNAYKGGAVIAGGNDTGLGVISDCLFLNPATLAWEALAPMNATYGRQYHAATILSDDTLLVVGGENDLGASETVCSVYDFKRNKWTDKPDWTVNAHIWPYAFELASKNILVVGGVDANQVSIPSELLISKYSTVPASSSSSGGLNGLFRVVSVLSPTSFTFSTPETRLPTSFTTGTVSGVTASTNSIQGPFIYDPDNGVAVTSAETTTATKIEEGKSYNILSVADASEFPDGEGWLCLGFGTKHQLQPVHYLGRISDTILLLDPTYTFPKNLEIGTTVTLLKQRGPWIPSNPEEVGSFYTTAAASGRIAASNTVDDVVAAGVKVEKVVVYPSDKGLGNEGAPDMGSAKISDRIAVWGGDSLDAELAEAREG